MSAQPHIMCMRVQCSVRVVIDCVTVTVGYLRSPFESNAEKTNVDGSGARSRGPAPCLASYCHASRRSWRHRTAATEEWRVIASRGEVVRFKSPWVRRLFRAGVMGKLADPTRLAEPDQRLSNLPEWQNEHPSNQLTKTGTVLSAQRGTPCVCHQRSFPAQTRGATSCTDGAQASLSARTRTSVRKCSASVCQTRSVHSCLISRC